MSATCCQCSSTEKLGIVSGMEVRRDISWLCHPRCRHREPGTGCSGKYGSVWVFQWLAFMLIKDPRASADKLAEPRYKK